MSVPTRPGHGSEDAGFGARRWDSAFSTMEAYVLFPERSPRRTHSNTSVPVVASPSKIRGTSLSRSSIIQLGCQWEYSTYYAIVSSCSKEVEENVSCSNARIIQALLQLILQVTYLGPLS